MHMPPMPARHAEARTVSRSNLTPCNAHPDIAMEFKMGHGGARLGAGRKPGSSRPNPIPDKPLGPRWYVIQCLSGSERITASELTRQGWTNFMPMQEIEVRDRVTPSVIRKATVPLLTGYLFVQFDRDGNEWGALRHNNPKVLGVLKVDGLRPTPVSDAQMERFRDRAAQEITLADPRAKARAPGEVLRVCDGPFMDAAATVAECDGLATTAEVMVLGRRVPVVFRYGQLEAVS